LAISKEEAIGSSSNKAERMLIEVSVYTSSATQANVETLIRYLELLLDAVIILELKNRKIISGQFCCLKINFSRVHEILKLKTFQDLLVKSYSAKGWEINFKTELIDDLFTNKTSEQIFIILNG